MLINKIEFEISPNAQQGSSNNQQAKHFTRNSQKFINLALSWSLSSASLSVWTEKKVGKLQLDWCCVCMFVLYPKHSGKFIIVMRQNEEEIYESRV